MGCVLPAGLGQAPARQVALRAGLPISTQATTVNKMCGSGMQAAILAHDRILSGGGSTILVGGMKSMFNAPHLLPRQHQGIKLGHVGIDSMSRDELEDAYEEGALARQLADRTAVAHKISREYMDEFALRLRARANTARDAEIVPITIEGGRGSTTIDQDEQHGRAWKKVPHLMPAFEPDWRTNAANPCSISDGAATMTLLSADRTADLAEDGRVRIVVHGGHAANPYQFCAALGFAMGDLLEPIG